MAYLGKTPSQAVRSRYYYTATGGETSLSGADDNSNVLTFTDGNYVDVSLNGATLVAGSDYNTTTANTIGGLAALTASDVVEVVVYDTFSVFGGNMAANLNFKDNVKANFGTDNDLVIYHDGSNSIINDAGTGSLKFQYGGTDGVVFDSSGRVGIGTSSPTQALTVNGQILSIASSGASFKNITPTTGNNYMWLGNTGNNLYVGKESSAGGTLFVGSSAYAAVIGNDGAYPLQFATNNNVRATIDSSGNVGIGTSSPSATLQVQGTTNGLQSVFGLDSSGLKISTFQKTGNDAGVILDAQESSNGTLTFATTGSERMRIDSSGNVGIGTSSPAHLVDAINTAGSATARFGSTYNIGANNGTVIIGNGGSGNAMLRFDYEGTNTDRARIGVSSSSQQLEFYTAGNNERMRITDAGTILVGKTAENTANDGIELNRNDVLVATRNNDAPLLLNRRSSDGEIAVFRKDNSTVGSISTAGGDLLIYSTEASHGGLRFGETYTFPVDNTGATSDGAIDLGASFGRFKDLYLSGGVYLGGTGSANHLDDYEEGTWLGTLKGLASDPSSAVQATGTYTKIGRTVHVEIKFSNVSNVGASGNAFVIGIPFTPAIAYAASGNCAAYLFDFPNGRTSLSVQVSTSSLYPYVSGDSVDWDGLKHAPGTARYLEISAQYIVA